MRRHYCLAQWIVAPPDEMAPVLATDPKPDTLKRSHDLVP